MSASPVRTRAVALTLTAVMAVTSACSFGPPDPDEQGTSPNLPKPSAAIPSEGGGEQEIVATVLAKDLEVPTGIAFLPDGAALVTERDTGRILRVGPDSGPDGLKVTEAQRLGEVKAGGQAGLLGIAVSPKYATDKTLYVYFSTATDNRIAELQLGGKLQPILTGIPRSDGANGGALAFGPDGFLYAGTGDGTAAGSQAANPRSLGGKILRITTAGKPAPGNPALAAAKPGTPATATAVWSTGHHDVQGIAWDKSKRLYAGEAGQKRFGELNVIVKGKNYGWPAADGPAGDPKLTNPLFSWPIGESSCAGVAVLEQTLATSCLLGKRAYLLGLTGNGTILGTPQAALNNEFGRLRTMAAAPDGSLWVSTSNQEDAGDPGPDDDRIIRLVFSDGGAGRS